VAQEEEIQRRASDQERAAAHHREAPSDSTRAASRHLDAAALRHGLCAMHAAKGATVRRRRGVTPPCYYPDYAALLPLRSAYTGPFFLMASTLVVTRFLSTIISIPSLHRA